MRQSGLVRVGVGTGSVPMSGNGSSTTFTITQNSSVTWNWQGTPIQWKLAIASNHDCPNPGRGNHMYNDSDSVTCKVTSSVTEGGTVWSCTGWTGTGSVPASGSGLSVTFVIIENSSITWKWRGTPIQWKLTVVSGHDCPVPSRGITCIIIVLP